MKTSNEGQFHRRSCGQPLPTKTVNTLSMRSYLEAFPNFSRSWFSLALVVALICCASFFGCTGSDKQQKAQAASPRAVSVSVAKVEEQEMPVYLVGLGSVTAFYTANIKSRVDGQIMRVNFREGQIVKEGDLLIVIDPRPYQVQLEQMQAQLFKDQATPARCQTEPGALYHTHSLREHCATAGRYAEVARGSARRPGAHRSGADR